VPGEWPANGLGQSGHEPVLSLLPLSMKDSTLEISLGPLTPPLYKADSPSNCPRAGLFDVVTCFGFLGFITSSLHHTLKQDAETRSYGSFLCVTPAPQHTLRHLQYLQSPPHTPLCVSSSP